MTHLFKENGFDRHLSAQEQKQKLLELAERLETSAAAFPKKLFVEAHDLIWPEDGSGPRGFFDLLNSGGYLDAVATLVPKGMVWSVDYYPDHSEAVVRWPYYGGGEVRATTPALALCAAALRARAAQ